MSPRDWIYRLEDIQDALNAIALYIDGMDYREWESDQKTIDAVIRNIEIIGEAAAHVPEVIQKKHQDVPWEQMRGIRNMLIHEYFGVDVEIIWKTVKEDLPSLLEKISVIRCD